MLYFRSMKYIRLLFIIGCGTALLLASFVSVAKPGPACDTSYLGNDSTRLTDPLQPLEHGQSQALATFKNVFGHLNSPSLAGRIRESYAKQLYFNDTFKVLHQRKALVEYLTATAEKSSVNVTPLAVIGSGNDYYITWCMEFRFTVWGEEKHSKSMGITHLRFNEKGEIILHRDFWDSAQGFYQYLPVVGWLIQSIRSNL